MKLALRKPHTYNIYYIMEYRISAKRKYKTKKQSIFSSLIASERFICSEFVFGEIVFNSQCENY